jgi:membrane protein implicated in regulation of membrane protease activity
MMARLIAAAVGVMLLAYVAAVVFSALAVGLAAYVAARDARRHERAELLARAEIQHRWSLAGDPRGTYGRYPPASIT